MAVITPTTGRKEVLESVKSFLAQDFDGSAHMLIGVDKHLGPSDIFDMTPRDLPKTVPLPF